MTRSLTFGPRSSQTYSSPGRGGVSLRHGFHGLHDARSCVAPPVATARGPDGAGVEMHAAIARDDPHGPPLELAHPLGPSSFAFNTHAAPSPRARVRAFASSAIRASPLPTPHLSARRMRTGFVVTRC